jgi:hypothetical protein
MLAQKRRAYLGELENTANVGFVFCARWGDEHVDYETCVQDNCPGGKHPVHIKLRQMLRLAQYTPPSGYLLSLNHIQTRLHSIQFILPSPKLP